MSTLVRTLALLSLLCLVAPAQALAKARFMAQEELLAKAPLIALVEVTSVAAVDTKGKFWTYRQQAQATLVQSVRGEVPARFSIHAQKSFICARASYTPGRYLVFLQREGALYTTLNHQFGQFAVKEGRLEFFQEGASLERKEEALSTVLKTISAPAAYFPESILTPDHRYQRDTVKTIEFPDLARVLGKHRLLRGIYANRPTPTGNVRVTYLHNRYLLVEPTGAQRPLDDLQAPIRKVFLAQAVVATSAKERAWVAAAYLFLVQGGEKPFGTWWGSAYNLDKSSQGGHVFETRWVHGKSFSSSDVYRFRYDAQGRLLAIDHKEIYH
ncbi:MAG: hypothetical protein JKY65_33415 [Planctomycetes bacterium]|nr:hypothetical protein [Planctomycetota bacterium]